MVLIISMTQLMPGQFSLICTGLSWDRIYHKVSRLFFCHEPLRRRGSGICIKLTLDPAQQGYKVLLDRKNVDPFALRC